MRPTAIKVTPKDNFRLFVVFDSGESGTFDVSPLISGSWYGELNDKDYFEQVRINGISVEWPNGQDICPDDLYYLSTKVD